MVEISYGRRSDFLSGGRSRLNWRRSLSAAGRADARVQERGFVDGLDRGHGNS